MIINIDKTSSRGLSKTTSIQGTEIEYHVFGSTYKEDVNGIILNMLQSNTSKLKLLEGNFSIVALDKAARRVIFLSDRGGKQNLFFKLVDGSITVSDDLWELKRDQNLTLQDVDRLAVKQQIFFFTPLGGKTFFKGVEHYPAATITSIDLKNDTKVSERYWHFSFTENTYSHADKFDIFDETFSKSVRTIVDLHPDESTFALGLSGGLDSRIIPYYAQKHGMDIEAFTIGTERPRGVLKSNDFRSADQIANHFGISRKTVAFDGISFKEQLEMECELAPETSSQIFKIVDSGSIKSRVLITGASGFLIGASPMYSSILETNLLEHTLRYQSMLGIKPKYSSAKKALNALFGFSFNDRTDIKLDGFGSIFSSDEIEQSLAEISTFYDEFHNLSDIEKLMNYAIFILGRNNEKGAFESMLDQKQSYSIYNPYFLDVIPYLSESDLLDRALFRKFVSYRIPEISGIQGQDFRPAINASSSVGRLIHRVGAMGNFVIRGYGVMNYKNWVHSRSFKRLSQMVSQEYDSSPASQYLDLELGDISVHHGVTMNALKMKKFLAKL